MTQSDKPYLILVGIDYSATSELALEGALELAAARSNAELHVVHVIPASGLMSQSDTANEVVNEASLIEQNASEQLKTYIAVSVGAFEKKRDGVVAKSFRVVAHLRAHSPDQEIAQLASDLEADLVVVGMHGRGSVTRFFLGSVAENVSRLAPCPVLIFRPKGLPPEYPRIEPPCPRCVETRIASKGSQYWCEQHRERHGQRHVYHQTDRMSEGLNLPLVLNQTDSNT